MPAAGVLHALENARVQGIKLTLLDMTASDGAVRVEVEFSDQAALMHLLEALNAGEDKPRWRLQQAQMGASGTSAAPGGTTPSGLPTATLVSRWANE